MTATSNLQLAILDALPDRAGMAITVAGIFERLGVREPTNVQSTSLSRSLARVAYQGLALRWNSQRFPRGKGYLWTKA